MKQRPRTPGLRDAKLVNLEMRDGNRCGICGEKLNPKQDNPQSPDFTTLDHIVPKSKGGSDLLDNLRLAHLGCNAGRGSRVKVREMLGKRVTVDGATGVLITETSPRWKQPRYYLFAGKGQKVRLKASDMERDL